MLLIAVISEHILHCKLTTCSIDWNKYVSNGTLLCYKDKTDLSDTVGTTTESLRRYSEVVCGQKIISAPLQKDSSSATQPPQTTNAWPNAIRIPTHQFYPAASPISLLS